MVFQMDDEPHIFLNSIEVALLKIILNIKYYLSATNIDIIIQYLSKSTYCWYW